MQRPTDPVATDGVPVVVGDDSVAAAVADRCDGRGDVPDASAQPSGADAGPQRLTGCVHERTDVRGRGLGPADDPRAGGVGVEATQADAAVDAQHVPVAQQDAGVRDAVDDLVVARGVERRRVAAPAQEARLGTAPPDLRLGEAIELRGRDAGLDGLGDSHVHLGQQRACFGHLGDLGF